MINCIDFGLNLTQRISEDMEPIDIPFVTSKFPAGEIFFKIDSEFIDQYKECFDSARCHIHINPSSSDDILLLLNAHDAIRRIGFGSIHLVMPYVPYGRQDRVMSKGEALSLKVFADIINNCNFESVTIWTPHSSVTPALINNVIIKECTHLLRTFPALYLLREFHTTHTIISPDAGAEKRCNDVYQFIQDNDGIRCESTNVVVCTKHRDVVTGQPVLSMNGQHVEKTAIIIDDICDGGRTFIELAKMLRTECSVETIILVVTHGIFSAGLTPFIGLIDKIYAFNIVGNFIDSNYILGQNLMELDSKS